MWRTFATLVSKVATGPRQVWAREPPRNSRIPRRAKAGAAPWRTASSRVFGRLIENACVGPPSTTRSISLSKSDNSSPARTTHVEICPLRPAATARATSSVLPNIDSYTTMAFIPLPPRAAPHTRGTTSRVRRLSARSPGCELRPKSQDVPRYAPPPCASLTPITTYAGPVNFRLVPLEAPVQGTRSGVARTLVTALVLFRARGPGVGRPWAPAWPLPLSCCRFAIAQPEPAVPRSACDDGEP